VGAVLRRSARTSETLVPTSVPTIRPAAVAAVSVLVLVRISLPEMEVKPGDAPSINGSYVTPDTLAVKSSDLSVYSPFNLW